MWSRKQRGLPLEEEAAVQGALREWNDATQYAQVIRAMFHYANGDWRAFRAVVQQPDFTGFKDQEKSLRLLSEMTPAELNSAFTNPAESTEEMDALAVALAFALAGQAEQSGKWEQRALEILRQNSHADRDIAGLIDRPAAPTLDDARNCWARPDHRALLFAYLAQKFPAASKELSAEARAWQLVPLSHYWIVERALMQLSDRKS
jgi:hypothetical protein